MVFASRKTQQMVLKSVACGLVVSQPFAVYADAYPTLDNQQLTQSRTLMYGQHSQSVLALQKKLATLNFYKGKADGEYTVQTEFAVKQFQLKYNLLSTGQSDKETLIQLMKVERDFYLAPLSTISEEIHPGEHGEDVKKVQSALYYFGYYHGEIDGLYGPATASAIRYFQKQTKLPETEKINTTFYKTLAEHQKSLNENTGVYIKKKTTKSPIQAFTVSDSVKSNVIAQAKQYMGVPYVWGGTSPRGFDCSGYVQYVFMKQDITIPRTVHEIWNVSKPVEKPSVGDLVFFETYQPGPSHMGIYIGEGKFIHAGTTNGVTISELNTNYWQQRYLGAKRVVIHK